MFIDDCRYTFSQIAETVLPEHMASLKRSLYFAVSFPTSSLPMPLRRRLRYRVRVAPPWLIVIILLLFALLWTVDQ
jgi:hypothetical protein